MDSLMFDFREFYDKIAEELPNDCRVAEVGIADGASMIYLCKKLRSLGKKFKMYGIDNMGYGGYEQMKTIYTNVIESGLGQFIEIIPYDSVEASKKFNDNYLHFVYLDSSHEYESTKEEIKAWFPKLIDGYKLAGHDYDLYEDVKNAVTELIPNRYQRESIHTAEQHQDFEEEQFLFTEPTSSNYGLWYCVKDFYKKLNDIK